MIGLDTNVLVRLFAEDDVRQKHAAAALLEGLTENEKAFVNALVVAELVWTLRRSYGFNKFQIGATLRKLSEHPRILLWDRDIIRDAAHLHLEEGGDVADHIIALINRAAGCSVTYTFDEEASTSRGFALIET